MKIVFYTDEDIVIEVVEGVQPKEVTEDSIEWDWGKMTGIHQKFAIIEDNISISNGDVLDTTLDKKADYYKKDMEAEMEKLREQSLEHDLSLATLFETILG